MESKPKAISPIIFLDIDGVLLPFGEGSPVGSDFPDGCLAALSDILSATGARIVLSSTWRCDATAIDVILANFRRFASVHGGPLGDVRQINDTTSVVNHTRRQGEIAEWLWSNEGLGVVPWIALDDEELTEGSCDEDLRADFEGHVVQTHSSVGLTSKDAEVAVALLCKQQAPQLRRELSEAYQSHGASRYTEAVLVEWSVHRDRASAAMRRGDWAVAVSELQRGVELRPDWAQGCLGIHAALTKIGDVVAAENSLRSGLSACTDTVRKALEDDFGAQGCTDGWFALAEKLAGLGSDLPCQAIGLTTRDEAGEVLTLYRDAAASLLLHMAPSPLRLLFLDVDGVLNTQDIANGGALLPEPLTYLRSALAATRAVVVLSTSWRNFSSLRPLIAGVLAPGIVVGQTSEGFFNHVRPREIASFLSLPDVQHALAVPGAGWAVVDDMDLLAQAEALAPGDASMGRFLLELQLRFVRTDGSVGLDGLGENSIRRILGEVAV